MAHKTAKEKSSFFHLLFFHFDKKVFYILVGALIVLAVISFAFVGGYNLGQNKSSVGKSAPTPKENGPVATAPSLFNEIFSLGGKVKTVESNAITFETQIAPDPQPQVRKALVTKDTVTTKFEVIKKDGKISGRQTSIKISNIKKGDTIVAAANENIKDKKEFTATTVQLLIPPKN